MNADFQKIIAQLTRIADASQKDWWDRTAVLLLVANFFVVAYYAWETIRLRKAAEKQVATAQNQTTAMLEQVSVTRVQTELSISPIVTLATVIEANNEFLAVRNLGSGPAFQVSVRPVDRETGMLPILIDAIPAHGYVAAPITFNGESGPQGPYRRSMELRDWLEANKRTLLPLIVACVDVQTKPYLATCEAHLNSHTKDVRINTISITRKDDRGEWLLTGIQIGASSTTLSNG